MGLYQYDSTEDKLNLVAGSTNFSDAPVGAIFPFGGTDIPVSFLLCDGSAVSRTDYEDLFNVIGTAFGTGDGSTTFNLPDLRGEFLRGAGTNSHSGQGNGGAVGEHQDATKLPNIYLSANATLIVTPDKNSLFNQVDASTGESTGYKGVAATSAGGDHISVNLTTRPTNTSVNYIIKAKQIGMPADFASAVGDIVVDKNTYSTSETIVGKWIDGKTIYRRVFTGLTRSSVAGQWVDTGANITGMNVGIIVWFMAFDNTYNINRNAIDMRIDDGKLKYYTGFENPFDTCTIEYTKTTDG